MFLLILDKNPYRAAELIPDRLKFKQLLELGQLICSTGISDVFKPIRQGKELQKWIKTNNGWTYSYMRELYLWVIENIKIKDDTQIKLNKILWDLHGFVNQYDDDIPKTTIFRYVKEYAEMTSYESNAELPIDVAISEYKRYLEYKEKEYNKKRCKK